MLENETCLQPGGARITGNYQMSNDFEVQQSICRFVASWSPQPDPILLFLQTFLPKSACVRAWCPPPPNEAWYQGTTPPPLQTENPESAPAHFTGERSWFDAQSQSAADPGFPFVGGGGGAHQPTGVSTSDLTQILFFKNTCKNERIESRW